MSQENVEALRRGFAVVNHGDIDGLLVNVHPDVEFTSLIAEAEGETFRGDDGVRRWWKEVALHLGGLHGEPEEVRGTGPAAKGRRLVEATGVPQGSRPVIHPLATQSPPSLGQSPELRLDYYAATGWRIGHPHRGTANCTVSFGSLGAARATRF